MAEVTKGPKKIKPQIIIACAAAAVVAIGVAAFFIIRHNSNLLANTVRFLRMQGEVTLLDGKDKEVSIQESMRLSDGNKVITATASFAALGLDDFKIVSLDESTKTGINRKGKKLELDLQSGGLYFNVTKALEDDEEFNIRTSTMITGIRGTCGYISADELYLLEGHVVTTNNFGESIEVEAGQKLIVDAATGKMRIEKYTLYDLPLLVISELARDDVRRAQVLAILGISEDEFWAYAWGLEPAYFDWADLGRERPKEPEEEPEPEVVEEPEEEPAEEPKESKAEESEEEEPAEEEPEEEEPVEKTYTITVTASEGGTISASASSAKEGEVISLKAVADGGKEIARWEPDGNVTLDFTNGLDCPTFVMPATNVSVHVAYGYATSTENAHSVTFTTVTGGTASASVTSASSNSTVTITATPATGYSFAGWTVVSGGVTLANANLASTTFTMQDADVEIRPSFALMGYYIRTTVTNSARGFVQASPSPANYNQAVTLVATPNDSNWVVEWNVKSGGVSLTGNTFTMPANDVELEATFKIPAGMIGASTPAGNGEIYLNESGATGMPDPNNPDTFVITSMGDKRECPITYHSTSYVGFPNNVLQDNDILYYDSFNQNGEANTSLRLTNGFDVDANVIIKFNNTSVRAVASFMCNSHVGPSLSSMGQNLPAHQSDFRIESGNLLFTHHKGDPGNNVPPSWDCKYTDPATGSETLYQVIGAYNGNQYEIRFEDPTNPQTVLYLLESDQPGTRPHV